MLKGVDGVHFINIDHDKMYQEYADKQGAKFELMDLSKGLPMDYIAQDGDPLQFINISQFLEHLNLPDAITLLDDCYRYMDHGAKIRISVPDTELLLFHLKTNQMDKFDKVQPAKWYGPLSEPDDEVQPDTVW